jgi:hypothetical protein
MEPLLDLFFFSFFSNMMAKNVILGPPSKSTGAQNGARNLIISQKCTEFLSLALALFRFRRKLARQRPHETPKASIL